MILVEFWAPYCAPCIRSFPHFQEIHEQYANREDFAMVSVSSGGRERSVGAFDSFNARRPLLFWREDIAAADLRPFSIPAAYVIDRNGIVVASMIRGEKIDEVLESLLE